MSIIEDIRSEIRRRLFGEEKKENILGEAEKVREEYGDVIIYISHIQTVPRLEGSRNIIHCSFTGYNYFTKKTEKMYLRVDVNAKTIFERNDIDWIYIDTFFEDPEIARPHFDFYVTYFNMSFRGKVIIYQKTTKFGLEVEIRGEYYR